MKVSIDTYDSNETLLAKLKSGSTGYDIVVISSDFVPIFVKEGLIQRVDAAHLPGFANVDPRWRHPAWDKDEAYTVPFGWGVTGFAINTKYIKTPVDSLRTLFEPPAEAKGKVGMFSAPDGGDVPRRGRSRPRALPDGRRGDEERLRPAGGASAERQAL